MLLRIGQYSWVLFFLLTLKISAQWVELEKIYLGSVNGIGFKDNLLFLNTSQGIFKDDGTRLKWKNITTSFPPSEISTFYNTNEKIFVGVNGKIFFSENDGELWKSLPLNVTAKLINKISENKSYILCLADNVFYYTKKDIINWQLSRPSKVLDFAVTDTSYFASYNSETQSTKDLSTTWQRMAPGGGRLLLGDIGQIISVGEYSSEDGYHFSSRYLGYNPKLTAISSSKRLFHLYKDGPRIMFFQTDPQWIIPQLQFLSDKNIYQSLNANSDYLYVGTKYGVFTTIDSVKNWNTVTCRFSEPSKITSIIVKNEDLIVGTMECGVFFRNEKDKNWITRNDGLQGQTITSLVNHNNTIFAGTNGNGVFRFDDTEKKWVAINVGLENANSKIIRQFLSDGDTLTVLTEDGLFNTLDLGNTWINKNDGLTGNNYKAISKCNSAYFVLFDNSIYKHEKNKLWEKVSIPSSVDNIKTMLSYDKYIFINYYNKIYCTKDNGMTWENFTETLSNTVISKLTTNNNLLFATTIDGIYYTKIGTSNWKSFNEGLINENIESIFVTNDLIYVATESARIFKNNLSNLSSIIKERVIPASFRLGQNYPNPFNPATNISYSISKTSIVILKVYDVLGNDICTLLNKIQNPGEYIVKYEPWNITSGIYYYALIVDNTKLVKKMILIK
ncbi:MAG: hypothetical protein A2499_01270 [Stygiobacter sp. RIFOXYC12_FULL_38_8]|nr:MAG: hypothetical protein A2299_00865 [Stygiobacter sp. RIFOXYB2_FULL_37_11]OGV16766.1 MAG: hypothetical protein A2440_05335 [Stygiobacter sp. RIFOXYC2_FULL_38_25]OGV29445.1 MAG: hypothetical protein A2499_01270 [Stygiobacter sp. RIFOXYC12_FULL_38_8]OGV82883.1 MAG: hypothetical protein A2X65_12820 [Stygiobacter sp. GWF2_38_21]RJQ61662.1 MAG: T9SS C-terminal target domain-containing protein [Stygiobacter sp.]